MSRKPLPAPRRVKGDIPTRPRIADFMEPRGDLRAHPRPGSSYRSGRREAAKVAYRRVTYHRGLNGEIPDGV